MRKLRKIIYLVTLISVMGMLQACSHDDPVIKINSLSFSVKNLSDLNGTIVKSTDENVTYTWNININVNGNKYSYSGTSNKNVLPVLAGNEIEVTFNPSADENEATLTLPDGTIRKVTREEPSFKWTVPQTITTGDQITGISFYRKENVEYKNTGRILFEIVE